MIGLESPEDVAEARTAIDAARASAGREVDPVELVVQVVGDASAEAWAEAGASWVLTQVGPYRMGVDEVREAVVSAP